MNKPKSPIQVLSDLNVIWTAHEEIGREGRIATIKTTTPLTDKQKLEIERGAAWYGGPCEVIFEVGEI